MNHRRTFTAYLLLAVAVAVADQATKHLAVAVLSARSLELSPFASLVLVFNDGAAFGFLSNAGGWQKHFLAVLSAAVSALLVCWLWRSHRALLSVALALVLGGALGNLVDRVVQQQVTDFILLHYAGWHFPAFNLADAAITVGAAVLIFDSVRQK